jgi:hypothetical protein
MSESLRHSMSRRSNKKPARTRAPRNKATLKLAAHDPAMHQDEVERGFERLKRSGRRAVKAKNAKTQTASPKHSLHQRTSNPTPHQKQEKQDEAAQTPEQGQLLTSDVQSAKRRLFDSEKRGPGAGTGEGDLDIENLMRPFVLPLPPNPLYNQVPPPLEEKIILRASNATAPMGASPLRGWQQHPSGNGQHLFTFSPLKLGLATAPRFASPQVPGPSPGICHNTSPPSSSSPPLPTSYCTPSRSALLVYGPPHPGAGWGSCGRFA